jgi:predicted metal-dependent HD superfamily phosphohydrolase
LTRPEGTGMRDVFSQLMSLVPVPPAAAADLRARLTAPDRHYHGLAHVELLWQRHRRYAAGALAAPPWHGLIACAIAFHDAVYDAARKDNEARSAQLWRDARPALPDPHVEWVEATILATADHLGAAPEPGQDETAWAARAWMLDLDLTPLGEEPAAFAANTQALRREFHHLTDAQWHQGRAAFLRRFAAATVLFRTPALRDAFEAQTRANLAAGQ